MKRILAALVTILFALAAHAQSPVVQAHLEPTKNILVGQPVRLTVTVYVPNYFTGSPEFPEFDLENAIVVLPQDRPENSNTQIGGIRYAGITETYVIYPQQAGDFHLPLAQLTIPYANAPPKSITATAHLPALTFHADVPAAARDLSYFLPTTKLTIDQHWSRPLTGLRTGDSIERTVTVTATRMQAMLIPPLQFEQLDGVHIYPSEPVVRDQKTARGDFIYGQRLQIAKYLIQKPGDYTLPPIELKWWNLATHHLVTAILPEVKFTAINNPDYLVELPPPPEAPAVARAVKLSPWKRYRARITLSIKLALGLTLLLLMVRLLRLARPHLASWWEQRKASEAAYFRRLLSAAKANDANLTYTLLIRWFGIAFPGVPLQTAVAADATLGREVDALAENLYSSHCKPTGSTWNGTLLGAELKQLRHDFVNKQLMPLPRRRLLALNPKSGTRQ